MMSKPTIDPNLIALARAAHKALVRKRSTCKTLNDVRNRDAPDPEDSFAEGRYELACGCYFQARETLLSAMRSVGLDVLACDGHLFIDAWSEFRDDYIGDIEDEQDQARPCLIVVPAAAACLRLAAAW